MEGKPIIVINWKMSAFDNIVFREAIDSTAMKNDYCGWGAYYANFVWVYCIKNSIKFDLNIYNQSDWRYLCEFIEVDYEKSIKAPASIVCESLNKLSTLIYQSTFYCLKNHYKQTEKYKIIYRRILEHCRVIDIKDSITSQVFNKDYCITYLQDGAAEIDRILSNICSESSKNNIINEIINAINEYIGRNDSKNDKHMLLKEYIRAKRCIAAYVFNQPQNEMRGYITFSGFNECEDETILETFNGTKNDIFIGKIIEIAESLNFILIVINKDVSTYKIPYSVSCGAIAVKSKLGEEPAPLSDNKKRDYSCAERKIFTAFYPKKPLLCLPSLIQNKYSVGYYIGKLYIQKPPCAECCLGIKYEWENGHLFEVKPQLYSI